LPTRDDIVAAWGDHVLVGLGARARARFQAGRFVAVEDDVAVLALPNEAHKSAAQPHTAEVATALAAHFGQKIKLRLVVEGAADDSPERANTSVRNAEAPDVDEYELLDELATRGPQAHVPAADSGLSWAKDRLLEAFPGAEEVGGT
jgi:hypothetical protein